MVWFGMVGFGVGLVWFVLPEELLSKAGMVAALLTKPDKVGMVWFRMVGFGEGLVWYHCPSWIVSRKVG